MRGVVCGLNRNVEGVELRAVSEPIAGVDNVVVGSDRRSAGLHISPDERMTGLTRLEVLEGRAGRVALAAHEVGCKQGARIGGPVPVVERDQG
jgi:hypothetical protein